MIEISPIQFFDLDTHLHNNDGIYVTNVSRKETKIPAHWSSRIPKRYKRNSIKKDLHRVKKIFINLKEEVKFIRKVDFPYLKVDFALPFINSVMKDFIN